MHSYETILNAFLLTLFAGLATSFGAAIAFIAKKDSYRFLGFCLAFSAGVMLYVSFVEIYPKGTKGLATFFDEKTASLVSLLFFFAGLAFIAVIDRLLPSSTNPHEARSPKEYSKLASANGETSEPSTNEAILNKARLKRMGLFTALAIALHNFPEGLVTFFSALEDPSLGIAIAVAIALHNIPEGMSVSVPLYYATGKKSTAFWYATLSGIAEPMGAILGYFLLSSFLTPAVMGAVFSAIAGIMVFISLDELLPTAREYSKGHDIVYGITAGMLVMGISLFLLT